MSQLGETSGVKRKRRPGPNPPVSVSLSDTDRTLLNTIKAKKDVGIRGRDIKWETKLPQHVVKKSLDSLLTKKMIKEVANIQFKVGGKHYMAVEFEPSKEVGGGVWYTEGILDQDLINALKTVLLKNICSHKVATADGLCDFLNKHKVVKFVCSKERVDEILNLMVLENEIMEVKSNGLGEYHRIPVDQVCYRAVSSKEVDKGPKRGPMALIPCGVCPMIRHCTMDGIISPVNCVYYKKWCNAMEEGQGLSKKVAVLQDW